MSFNELQDPDLQIVLYVKEGKDFHFVKQPITAIASLNGYCLQTERTPPGHLVHFNSQLIWEVTSKLLKDLRTQNVPIKVEVHSSPNDETKMKEKLGYFLVNLVGAQITPRNRCLTSRHTWHKLLGVPSIGKYHSPQLLIGLMIKNSKNNVQELNSVRSSSAYLKHPLNTNINEMLSAFDKYHTTVEVNLDEENGVINIGPEVYDQSIFLLSVTIGCAENLATLLPADIDILNEPSCYVSCQLFDQIMSTDKRTLKNKGNKNERIHFNQKMNHRLKTNLSTLISYFHDKPYCIIIICSGDQKLGVCSVDMRKVVHKNIADDSATNTVYERCFIISSSNSNSKRAFLDIIVELSCLKSLQKSAEKVSKTLTDSELTSRAKDAIKKCSITQDRVQINSCHVDSIQTNTELTEVLKQIHTFMSSERKLYEPPILTYASVQTNEQNLAQEAPTNLEHTKENICNRYESELLEWKKKEMEKYKLEIQKEKHEIMCLKNELQCNLNHCRNLAEQLAKATENIMERSKVITVRENKLVTARAVLEKYYTKMFRELEVQKKLNVESDNNQWSTVNVQKMNKLTTNAEAELMWKLEELKKENAQIIMKMGEENEMSNLKRQVKSIISRK